jgi:hypothetical protein
MAFENPIDVANRALQIIGVPRISNFTASKAGLETAFSLNLVRQAELRRSVWTFATRRAVLRPVVSTSVALSFAAYASGTTYAAGDIVADSTGYLWISIVSSNAGNTPGATSSGAFWMPYFGPTIGQAWDATVAYFPGDMVKVSSTIYIAVATSTNHTPPNTTYWHAVAGASGAATVQLSPLGVNGPAGATTRIIYKLPANYIRMAPQDPKAAAVTRPGLTAGMHYNDWEIEAGYLFTAQASPIILRFVADVIDMTLMDGVFCEAWAGQLAKAVCVPLTQSIGKMQLADAHYNSSLAMAKAMNAVEGGSSEPEAPEGVAQSGIPAGRGQ